MEKAFEFRGKEPKVEWTLYVIIGTTDVCYKWAHDLVWIPWTEIEKTLRTDILGFEVSLP